MKDSESNICQIAAIKDGRLVLSETFHGYSEDDCCHIASATKTHIIKSTNGGETALNSPEQTYAICTNET